MKSSEGVCCLMIEIYNMEVTTKWIRKEGQYEQPAIICLHNVHFNDS